jgi:hypothetical protein
MTMDDKHTDFAEWARAWQGDAPQPTATVEIIRDYVRRRGHLVRAFIFADLAIGAVALPLLGSLAWTAQTHIDRWSMIGLAAITLAAMAFGWWNWSGVRRASTATTANYISVSSERLRRMRIAWRAGWAVLAAELVVFTIWIPDRLYAGGEPSDFSERFAWTWLAGFTMAAAISLLWFGRWLTRDADRFERLRTDLELGGSSVRADGRGVDQHR